MTRADDERFMEAALGQARRAVNADEVPIGAVAVLDGKIIGAGYNCPISKHDPTAHAEMVAIRAAAVALGTYRLERLALYVTLEPCVMCVGAMVYARIARLVYGARDEKAGAMGSVYDIGRDGRLNHRIEVHAGVKERECSELLTKFFKARRT